MHLEIAVRFRNETYKEIGAGTIELHASYEDTPFMLEQLGAVAGPLVKSMIDHATKDARANLAEKVEKPDES